MYLDWLPEIALRVDSWSCGCGRPGTMFYEGLGLCDQYRRPIYASVQLSRIDI